MPATIRIWSGSCYQSILPTHMVSRILLFDTFRLVVVRILEIKSVPGQTTIFANIERCHPAACVYHAARNDSVNDDLPPTYDSCAAE
ncbi:hypothetical protein AVEN_15427-1 [Araneus ventricosus]|uniref:Uncharacterized protein n=1 Tax=Araneus ventricosus TaxID=182803 RepID=A0A4Y2CRU4_ARAVE|nr:hypothetical protein AVEN_15427-1 [Araneus ventricosus]